MRILDKLTLISLAEHDPERAVCVGVLPLNPSTLLHAKCAEKWLRKDAAYYERFRGVGWEKTINLPEWTDIAVWGNGCAECGRIVETQYLKPI